MLFSLSTFDLINMINPRLTKLYFVTRLTKGGYYNALKRFSLLNPL